MKDFFISYNRADKHWAEWIAWTLEAAGYSVVIQAWDFRPGENFVLGMHRAAAESKKTIAVLSESYLKASYTQPEWAVAFAQDPQSLERKLIPVRVNECKPEGMLRPIVYVDLVKKPEPEAKQLLLDALRDRVKPDQKPAFPDTTASPTALKGQPLTAILSSDERTVDLESAYRWVCPPDWSRPMPGTLMEILAELEDMQPDEMGYPATQKFVAYLMIADTQVPELLSKQLNQWAEKQNQNFSQLLQQIRQQTSQATAANTGDRQIDSYLMVVVNPSSNADQQKDKCYSVKAWLIPDAQNCQPKTGRGFEPIFPRLSNLENDEQNFTPDQICGLLRDFLTESGKKCSLPTLTIELFLPTELLNQPIDIWKLDDESYFPVPIGVDYRVILRSVERLREVYMAQRGSFWKKKWQSLLASTQQKANTVFVCGDGEPPNSLYQKLTDENVIGLKVVRELLSFEKRGAFAVLQGAAIPVALWLRQTLPAGNCVDEIEQLLSCCIHEVPEAVKRKRRDAFGSDCEISESPESYKSHIGYHLALLWEDVDRLPPDLTYYMP